MLLEHHDHIELDGKGYAIRNSSQSYITALKVLRSEDILEEDKVQTVLPLLFSEDIPEGLEVQAVIAFFELFSEKRKGDGKPSFDLVQDAEYIYAGFMQTYGIDLEDTDMAIERFIALLKGLPSGTRLADIIRIRTTPVPQRTKWNAQQVADIMKAKQEFALDRKDNGMGGFGRLIKEWARHGR